MNSVQGTTNLQPTPSMLVYLFADRLFQQKRRAKWKRARTIRVPCKDDVAVAAKDLAGGLFAVSFWNLREQGIISLEPFQKKTLLGDSTPALRVVKVNQIESKSILEALILHLLRDQAEDDVRTLVKRWFGSDEIRESQLYGLLIGIPAREAINLGYIGQIDSSSGEEPEKVDMPVTLGRFRTGPLRLAEGLEPRCEKIATLEGSFNDFALRMQDFQTTEAELYALLLNECTGAVLSCISSLDRPWGYKGIW